MASLALYPILEPAAGGSLGAVGLASPSPSLSHAVDPVSAAPIRKIGERTINKKKRTLVSRIPFSLY
jgi:hypothetical protein